MNTAITKTVLTDGKDDTIEKLPQLKSSSDILKQFDAEKLTKSDVIIILAIHKDFIFDTINEIRGNTDIFLKPLCVITNAKGWEEYYELADSIINPESNEKEIIDTINKTFKEITSKISKYKVNSDLTISELKKIGFLRFLISRQISNIKPKINKDSKRGYIYPTAMVFLSSFPSEEFKELDVMEDTGLLKSRILDTINLCPNCEHYQISIREICPDCRSSNIQTEKTIHCFDCAHISVETDFKIGDELICPKCNKRLQHIGIEYDRPNVLYVCNNCHKKLFEPSIDCLCMNCTTTFSSENMLHSKVKDYELTYEANVSAQNGQLPQYESMHSIKEKAGLIRLTAFKEILKYHISAADRYNRPLTLIRLDIKNIKQLITNHGQESINIFFDEFKELVRGELRTTDLVTSLGLETLYLLLTETKRSDSDIPLERIRHKVNQVLVTNPELSFVIYSFPEDKESIETVLQEI